MMMARLVTIALLLSGSCLAQTNASDAAIEGFISDPSGAPVPNAKVIAVAAATGQRLETVSDHAGYYRFALLRIGEYWLTAFAPSFAEYRRSGIILNVGREVRVNIALAIATNAEAVSVSADASMVETGVTGAAEILNERAIRNLPIASRNIYNLHLIGPGIKGVPSSNAATTAFFTGGLTRTTWTVDGIDATSRRNARQIRLGVVTPEAAEEMQLLAGGQSAEFGRSAGAVINIVTRGGTNRFHGSGMGMYRPNRLVARPPLAAAAVEQHWWLVAGNVSGPIVRDRLWFFINNEYNPYTEPQPVTISAANARALGLSAADTANSEYGETYHSPSVKINFQLKPQHGGFLRYSRFTNAQPVGRTGLVIAARTTNYSDRQNAGTAQWTSVLRPSLVSESRFAFSRRMETRNPVGQSGPDGAFIDIVGAANLGVNPLSGSEGIETSIQGSQNLTWNRGRHTAKGGVDYQNTELAVTNALTRTFAFNGLAAAAGRPAVTPVDQYLRTVRRETDPATGRLYTYTQLTQQAGLLPRRRQPT